MRTAASLQAGWVLVDAYAMKVQQGSASCLILWKVDQLALCRDMQRLEHAVFATKASS